MPPAPVRPVAPPRPVDRTPPSLVDVRGVTVRTALSRRQIDLAVRARDSGTGVAGVQLTLRSPDGRGRLVSASCRLTSGTAASGRWLCRLTLPPRMQLGAWTVQEARITDRTGNVSRAKAGTAVRVIR